MPKFGIMQGRLVPPESGRFQSFPNERWQDEFAFAKAAGLDYIEWIYDGYGLDVNPLLQEGGIARLQQFMKQNGIALRSMCADYFMDFPLLRCTPDERSARLNRLIELMGAAAALGMNRIVIPFVDASAITSESETAEVMDVLVRALPDAHKTGVELHLETSLGPAEFAALIARVNDPMLKVNYDSGNSASLGYDVQEEFAAYGEAIGSIHIKDRKRGAGTVPLGTGDANFPKLFECIARSGYHGDFTLQVARGTPGDEVAWAKQNLAFVKKYLGQ